MADAAKFGSICFTLQLVLLVIVYILFPDLYPGESFMVVFIYGINLIIAAITYPLFFRLLRDTNLNHKVMYFLLMFLIINMVSMAAIGKPYTVYLLDGIFNYSRMLKAYLFEFFDPLISFALTVVIMKKLKLYITN